ncbi:MAG TPA: nitroreductase family protein, partial [Alkalispirochaeta sp.]|nr:nitroreductase family protein [Alkalispirochaeta sp.]
MWDEHVLRLLESHASCRKYRNDTVPKQDIERIVSAAQRAATSSNLQMWTAVVVETEAVQTRLATLCGDQNHIRQAPVFIAWCADRSRLNTVATHQGYVQNTEYLESFLVAVVDAAIAMQNATVAAEAMGYGTCYIGGLRNNTADVVDLLQLPSGTFPVAGMTVGVPAKQSRPRPRLELPAVLHWERYRPDTTAYLSRYDQVMRDTGVYQGRHVAGTTADGDPAPEVPEEQYGWMEHSARRVSRPQRTDLSEVAQRQGFKLR